MIGLGELSAALTYRIQLLTINPGLRRKRIKWLANLTESDENNCELYVKEIEKDSKFLNTIRGSFKMYVKHYIPSPFDFMASQTGGSVFFPFVSMYAFIRLIKPEVTVETGGTPGKSSAFILGALQRNRQGKLYTIDLPPKPGEHDKIEKMSLSHEKLPKDLSSGWCVPGFLKSRHYLLMGRSEGLLPPLLEELREIDVFIHDSLHTYEHMAWEFETAWPHIRKGGFLLSDDINANSAWRDFCERHSVQPYDFLSLGVIRKE